MKFADLHLHTRYSDGSNMPAELVRAAQQAGLATIAVTDHDTMDGVAETQLAGQTANIEVIPGVEITCRVGETEIHLLGYFFSDGWKTSPLTTVLAQARQIREQRVAQFVAKLKELGFPITVADVRACATDGTLGRPHVAMALVRGKHVRNMDEAFERFLKRGKPAFVDRHRMAVDEAIGHIRRAGGVAVLAHPGLYRHVDGTIPGMVAQGLGGLEVWHSKHGLSVTTQYHKLANDLGLLATGGSDDHGPDRDHLIGTVKVPYERVEALRARTQS